MDRMMKQSGRGLAWVAGAAAVFASAGSALAQAPRPWEMGMQPAFSPVKERIIALNDLVQWLMFGVVIFVAALLGWVMFRYHRTRNPVASRTSHNTLLEVAWTLVPVLILVVIAIPSFSLVYYQDRTHDAALTVKATGHQWQWNYTYPDQGNFSFESQMIPDEELKPGQKRLLEVDNQMVVPVGKDIRILTTGQDVIHSFFIPSLGVQRYAIPGKTIETWFRVTKPGTYYGECNQICGINHSKMPIVVHAVSDAEFATWVAEAKVKFAQQSEPAANPSQLAAAAP